LYKEFLLTFLCQQQQRKVTKESAGDFDIAAVCEIANIRNLSWSDISMLLRVKLFG